ncbi:MAG TPA: IPT/TIG domain-containing protein [Solirubrobacterales bacterium]|nr:IPT/TIG domain-containing protein [Solirubrobacterales bacterium]
MIAQAMARLTATRAALAQRAARGPDAPTHASSASAKGSGAPSVRPMVLLVTVAAAFFLVPAAQAFASASVKVNVTGFGSGEIVTTSPWGGTPPMACSYNGISQGGICENTPEEEGNARREFLLANAAPGSEFGGWAVQRGPLSNEVEFGCPNGSCGGFIEFCPDFEGSGIQGPNPLLECGLDSQEPDEFEVLATFCPEGTAKEETVYNGYWEVEEVQLTGCASVVEYTLTAQAQGPGAVSAGASPAPKSGSINACEEAGGECEATYEEGETAILTATPHAHAHFVEWSGAGAGTCAATSTPTCEVEMSADKTVKAIFAPTAHQLSVSTTGTASVTATPGPISACTESGGTCSGQYDEAGTVTLNATGVPAHFKIVWAGVTCTVQTNTECQLTTPEADATVTAASTQITHTVTVVPTTGHGTVSATEPPTPVSGHVNACEEGAGECQATYAAGQSVTLQATSQLGFEVHWVTPGDCTNPSPNAEAKCQVSVTDGTDVSEAISFPAQAGQTVFTAATNGGDGSGTLLCDSGSGFEACHPSYAENTTVTLKASPDGHSVFGSLNVTGSSTTTCTGALAQCTVKVEATHVFVTASFAAIRLTSVSSSEGPVSGGTHVVLQGQNLGTVSVVKFGGTAASFTALGPNQIEATAPARAAGAVEVVTESSNGSSQGGTSTFTYIAVPTVSSISPVEGPATGNQTVTVEGTGLSNPTAVSFGGTPATNVVEVSPTKLTVKSPAHAAGQVDVTVTTTGGTSATGVPDHYTFTAAPAITSVSPSEGPLGGNQTVTIEGTGLANPTGVSFGGTPATNVVEVSPTKLTVKSPAHAAGQIDVTVTTIGGTSVTGALDHYTYLAAPTVATVSPSEGPLGGNQTVTIEGTGLANPGAVEFGGVPATNITPISSTKLTATSPGHAAGQVDVIVTTIGDTSATAPADHYTYLAAPAITSLSPSEGPSAGGQLVSITGTGFTGASKVEFGATAVTCDNNPNHCKVESATLIKATTPAGAAGQVDVTVTTIAGTSATGAPDRYLYVAKPTVTSISPDEGPTLGGGTVTVHGSAFTASTSFKFGANSATAVNVIGASEATMKVPGRSAGTVDVTATSASGTSTTSSADNYTYVAKPRITSISPASGSTAGGTAVTVQGSGFTAATTFEFGSHSATAVDVLSASEATMSSPPGAVGVVDVIATSEGGTSATSAADRFTYAVPTHSLAVKKAGSGSGSVSCDGAACASSYPQGAKVKLSASAASGSSFSGWAGACSGTGDCTVTIDADATVTATFAANPPAPVEVRCVVPALKGLSLSAAKSALTGAHCGLGTITKPKAKKGQKLGALIVKSSSPEAGAGGPEGTKVDLKLRAKPNQKKHKSHKKKHKSHKAGRVR